jgi:hypothetical protein
MLTADELTILTSWAEALAEALAFAPASIEALAADAQPGARWRDELQVGEPSPPLRRAINRMAQTALTAAAAGDDPPLEAARLAAGGSQPRESALDSLARAVLLSALQQRQNPATSRKQTSGSGRRVPSGASRRVFHPGLMRPTAPLL